MTSKERIDEILRLLPQRIATPLAAAQEAMMERINEIRLRANSPIALTVENSSYFVGDDGRWDALPERGLLLSEKDIKDAFMGLCSHSIYAYEDELKKGYFTLPGGSRIGVAGHMSTENGKIVSFGTCASLCIRIAREIKGCADFALPFLYTGSQLSSALILSPPMMGKTTMLRDMARQISHGVFGAGGKHTCVVDERGEIAACSFGIPQMDMGCRTDVLDGCPKALGMQMALRTLSPQVIVTDELGGEADANAVLDARFSGVEVIASAHGRNIDEVMNRPDIQHLARAGAFDRYFVLGIRPGKVIGVYGKDLQPLYTEGEVG